MTQQQTQTRPPAQRAPTNQAGGQNSLTRTEQIERKIDIEVARGMTMSPLEGGAAFVPRTAAEVMEFAKMMATSQIGVRKHLRDNPGACLAVCMQAARWAMDPFAVANKSYAVNDQLAFEAQLIAAVVNTRAPIVGRLKTSFEGEGNDLRCIAWATFEGDDEPTLVESPPFARIQPKNSPLWKSDPEQQLAYYTMRLWARRCCPEVLLGVYDVDELAAAPREMKDVTPVRPTREQFRPQGRTLPGVTDAQVVDEGGAGGEQQHGGPQQGDDDRGAAGDDDDAGTSADEGLDDTWQALLQGHRESLAGCSTLGDLALLDNEWRDYLKKPPAGAPPEDYVRQVNTLFIEARQRIERATGKGRR